jgi:hypothetical protein
VQIGQSSCACFTSFRTLARKSSWVGSAILIGVNRRVGE